MPVPRGLKGSLYRAGLFRPMRSVYRAIFNRSEFRSERIMCSFYSEWIAKVDLVFDVGANIGQYTEIFSSLGARVIAIEPNPALFEGLRFLTYGERHSAFLRGWRNSGPGRFAHLRSA